MRKLCIAGFFFFIAATLATCAADGVRAQDAPPTITVRKALEVLSGLRALDGRQVIVKDSVVMQPWDFKNGALRLVIASDITTLTQLEQTTDKARIQILLELRRNAGQQKLEPGTPEFEEFSRQYEDMLAKAWDGKLEKIDAKSLNLDINEIPASVLSALQPILR